ncbi:MAG: thioredoxin-dependent thiol peroxidase [Spirochaetales bacterium]|nr:thioredoxin-dependent thiol peroxidase [Spirochaetales bacterium]
MLEIGTKAPDFTLNNQDGQEVSLLDFVGKKVVIYFYPKDNTPGCTTEACGFRDVYDQILATGAVVLGVSKDSVKSHVNFATKFELPFHLLSDPDTTMIQAYDAWIEKSMYGKKYMGIARVTYIVDEAGNIMKAFEKVKPAEHPAEILEALK